MPRNTRMTSHCITINQYKCVLIQVLSFEVPRSTDCWNHSDNPGRRRSATHCPRLEAFHTAVLLEPCNSWVKMIRDLWWIAYIGSDQSRPVGHNKNPVRWCRKPRSVLRLRLSGGCNSWPRGATQSKIACFSVFVSSDLALAAPLRI